LHFGWACIGGRCGACRWETGVLAHASGIHARGRHGRGGCPARCDSRTQSILVFLLTKLLPQQERPAQQHQEQQSADSRTNACANLSANADAPLLWRVREGKRENLICYDVHGDRGCRAGSGSRGDLRGDRGDGGARGVGANIGGQDGVTGRLADDGLGVEGEAAVSR
jgi:hypothetical protein